MKREKSPSDSLSVASSSSFFSPERSVIDIVHRIDMQMLCKGTKVFVVVQEAAVVYLGCSGDDDVHSRDGYALASEFISGGIGKGPDSVADQNRLKDIEPCMHCIVFIPVPAALEQFKDNNICGGDREGVKRCDKGLLQSVMAGLSEADDPGGGVDEQLSGHRAFSSDRRG